MTLIWVFKTRDVTTLFLNRNLVPRFAKEGEDKKKNDDGHIDCRAQRISG
jgi:hypothetical protein